MSVTRIASRYAKSLLDLSIEKGQTDAVLSDILGFSKALESKDLLNMIKSPIINTSKKRDIFKVLFKDKFNELTFAFTDLVLNKGRESYLPDVAKHFVVQYNEMKKLSSAKLTVASEISDSKMEEIKAKMLKSNITLDNLELEVVIDPSIIGGFIIEIGDKLYDASVKYNLGKLKKEFTGSDYVASI